MKRMIAFFVGAILTTVSAAAEKPPYPRFEPTPDEIVDAMLNLAEVKPTDVVYDLGSGDGRIVITAAKKFSAQRAVGVELNADLVEEAEQKARKAGVADKVQFIQQDLFAADIGSATVVTLYLLPEVNLLLRPKLLSELKPGTRIISHSHDMGDWIPDKTVELKDRKRKVHVVHLWTVPPRSTQQ